MSGESHDFKIIQTRALINLFAARQGAKEIHAVRTETLGENATSYATVKHCVA
jgi:hypothetical protein